MLLRPAIAHHARLHFQRRILAERDLRLCDCEQRHTAHVRQFQRGLDVLGVEHLFDGGGIRPVLGEDIP
jgi:hypothetical protein